MSGAVSQRAGFDKVRGYSTEASASRGINIMRDSVVSWVGESEYKGTAHILTHLQLLIYFLRKNVAACNFKSRIFRI
jgi:hypothetical protein